MDLQIFKSEKFGEIRTVEENGKFLFCGSDVAKALGYVDTVNALKQHCKQDGVVFHHITDNLGRTQQAKFINEGNLYRLIAKSQLPEAEQFERWIFDEVLPSPAALAWLAMMTASILSCLAVGGALPVGGGDKLCK